MAPHTRNQGSFTDTGFQRARLRILVARIADGDREAFTELFDTMAAPMYAELANAGVARMDAIGVVSSTFVEVWWLARHHTGRDTDVHRWIYTIAARRGKERPNAGPDRTGDRDNQAWAATAEISEKLSATTLASLLTA